MKKVWVTFLTAFLLVVAMSSSALAAGWLSTSEIALGGITLDMTQNAVANIYGQPNTSTDRGILRVDGCHHVIWRYGDDFIIDFADGHVDYVKIYSNNGIQTPAGIHVGSYESYIRNAYGDPWLKQNNVEGTTYWYHAEGERKLFIDVLNGRVLRVAIGYE